MFPCQLRRVPCRNAMRTIKQSEKSALRERMRCALPARLVHTRHGRGMPARGAGHLAAACAGCPGRVLRPEYTSLPAVLCMRRSLLLLNCACGDRCCCELRLRLYAVYPRRASRTASILADRKVRVRSHCIAACP